MIYFAELPGSNIVKVGFTGGPAEKRLTLLKRQWGLSDPLKLLGTMPGGKAVERKVHRILSYYRVRGEWFFLERSVREFISTCIEKGDAELARAVHCDDILTSDEADHRLHEWDSYVARGLI